MDAMEARGHQQSFSEPAKGQPDIGVAQALDKSHEQHEHGKLQRRNADSEPDHTEPQPRYQIVQKVIAVIGPEAHLPLSMMQSVKRVPTAKRMGQTMAPVLRAVEDKGVNDESGHRVA